MREPETREAPLPRTLELSGFVGMPGINCWGVPNACGAIWGNTFERVRAELPIDHPVRTRKPWPVLPGEFFEIAASVREALKLPPDTWLEPGSGIGVVGLRLKRREVPDFEWPKLGTRVISERIRQLLVDSGFTGWHVEPVEVRGGPGDLQLHELVVGAPQPTVVDPPGQVSVCPVCRRPTYKWTFPHTVSIAPGSWDGSDFLALDAPLRYRIFVTERVRDALQEARVSNVEFVPIERVVEEIRPFIDR